MTRRRRFLLRLVWRCTTVEGRQHLMDHMIATVAAAHPAIPADALHAAIRIACQQAGLDLTGVFMWPPELLPQPAQQ